MSLNDIILNIWHHTKIKCDDENATMWVIRINNSVIADTSTYKYSNTRSASTADPVVEIKFQHRLGCARIYANICVSIGI